ncbi:MAG: DNA-binding protein WhiA [Trueperella sp.]|nr:DNA-binding protein WhiA [Trueperella sp.]
MRLPALTIAVKDEISDVYPRVASAMVAEISTLFRFGGGLQINGGVVTLQAEFPHPGAARHLAELLRNAFSVEADVAVASKAGSSNNYYVVTVHERGERIARSVGLLDHRGRPMRGLAPQIVAGSKADAAAAWRGAFLARGRLMEPGRNASLEVTCPSLEAAYAIGGLARRLDIPYRAREARGAYRVDIREGDAISAMLARMGANSAVLRWEELRTEREVHGQANRLANFDDANMRRSADAAVVAVIRVKRAFEILEDIPDNLRQAGECRIKYPEDSLNMLGERLEPKATKDAVAGRLRRLNTMADKRAAELGIPDTMDAVHRARRSSQS